MEEEYQPQPSTREPIVDPEVSHRRVSKVQRLAQSVIRRFSGLHIEAEEPMWIFPASAEEGFRVKRRPGTKEATRRYLASGRLSGLANSESKPGIRD